jgi:hypothetical protein
MSIKGWSATIKVAAILGVVLCGCNSKGEPFTADVQAINFDTVTVPAADAGRFYNVVVAFTATGGAALPDRFEVVEGVLPIGLTLERDREDANFDGLPDEDGAFTGNARVLGVPRQRGSYTFRLKAISTGALGSLTQPDLATEHEFSVTVGEGSVAILTPTAEEGTSDPAVPAFPANVGFVNPGNPEAFFSWAFQIAGGSNNNIANVYAPREVLLSAFDTSVVDEASLHVDVDESVTGNAPSKFEQDFSDGGLFVLQAGQQKVQTGGFQSPRGGVRQDIDPNDGETDVTTADPPFMATEVTPGNWVSTLLPEWFQPDTVPQDSRRDFADTLGLSAGDNTLGTPQPVRFTDYFHDDFLSTSPPFEAKYPFVADEYLNAFFVPYTAGVDLTQLQYRLIVEVIDTRGTPATKTDDVIARKAFIMRVTIPPILIDTVLLPAGQAGVPYNAQVALNGGVPPLYADLEHVDGANDGAATVGDPLTKTLFGMDIDPSTWMFVGAPRASAPDLDPGTPAPDGPSVELTVRAWAQVMNPSQNGGQAIPTGGANEFDGTSTATGKKGRHKTFLFNVELPTPPMVENTSLASGIDGLQYSETIRGSGGVPLVAPYPPGFWDPPTTPGTPYPSAQARTSYGWSAEYVLDTSHATPGATAAGLPNALSLEGNAQMPTSGDITGIIYDRGNQYIRFVGQHFYIGPSDAPTAGGTFDPAPDTFEATLILNVGPDEAKFFRGVQSSEGAGGQATGLLDSATAMAEPRMVPLLLAVGLFSIDATGTPVRHPGLPTNFDIMPVLIPNGGTEAATNMSIPQIRGYWPAEAGQERQWYYYPGLGADQAWKHCQQEFTWVQAPDADHTRVFVWAEGTTIQIRQSGTWNQRFQQLDTTKRRGIILFKPFTGDVYLPAILNPAGDSDHGATFGAEAVIGGRTTSSTGTIGYLEGGFYSRVYYYSQSDTVHDRMVHLHGASTYLQTYNTTYTGAGNGYYMNSMGRTGTSIAMSEDGIWCATALVGGSNTQKILLWRTDNQPIPTAIRGQSYVETVNGLDADGTTVLSDRAVIFKLGGVSASGTALSTNQSHLFPDSIKFVENGILFLNETQLDRIFGISLVDGHVSSIGINTARVQANTTGIGSGLGPTVHSTYGQFVPDNDILAGAFRPGCNGAQFAFAGNMTTAGEEGPTKVAFVAGTTQSVGGYVLAMSDLSSSSHPRMGMVTAANANKSLYYMALNTTNGTAGALGLDLGTGTVLRDLTGNDADVYGDLLSPGRLGEDGDFLALSLDGNYAAVARDVDPNPAMAGTQAYPASFANYYPYIINNSSYGNASHDLLLVSTSGADMHSGGATEHVLYMGTGQNLTTGVRGGMPYYAIQQGHLAAIGRHVHGLEFAPDNRRLIFKYSGDDYYNPASGYFGATNYQYYNPSGNASYGSGDQISFAYTFRTSGGAATDFTSASNFRNMLTGLSPGASIGQTSVPVGTTTSAQCFWATFKSPNGKYLYYMVDQLDTSYQSFTTTNRNYMVGFNITEATIDSHAPFTAFITHSDTIGFEQFDCNAWSYEGRFASSPGGNFFNGRDATGILCVIGNDSSANGSSTDLEVYVMDTNIGGSLFALTSSVTTGAANAINHLTLSANGNVLCGLISKTSTSSAGTRAFLNSNNSLFVVTNIHDVLGGGTPDAWIVSANQSHGATVAFFNDGLPSGPTGLAYSSGNASSVNTSWATRTLKTVTLVPGAVASVADDTPSHYVIIFGRRLEADDPTTID